MPGLLPYLGSKTHYIHEKFLCFLLIFEMFSVCHISFSSLVTYCSFCENRSHFCNFAQNVRVDATRGFGLDTHFCEIQGGIPFSI